MDKDVITEENSAAFRLSPAYKTTMEALSSLSTCKKRGGASNIGDKYKKLGRMLMYIEILGLEDILLALKSFMLVGLKERFRNAHFVRPFSRSAGSELDFLSTLDDVRKRFCFNGLDSTEDKFYFTFGIVGAN